jgi:hypothetical protein
MDGANPSFSSLDGVLFNKDQSILIRYPAGKTADRYTIPDGATSIGGSAFCGCTSLASVEIGDGLTSIGSSAFYGCDSLVSIGIPDSVSDIGYYAFSDCTSLARISIPDSVTNIVDCTFFGCTSLASILIPASVTDIGYYVFSCCTNLASVYFEGNAPSLSLGTFSGADNTTVYYLPGSSGWGTTFGGRPALLWNPTIDVGEGFGAGENGFGFGISGTTNIPIMIEACTNLAEGVWIPLQTNTLSSGALQFNDPGWTNHPSRIYRISGP